MVTKKGISRHQESEGVEDDYDNGVSSSKLRFILGIMLLIGSWVLLFLAWSMLSDLRIPKSWPLFVLLLGPFAALLLPTTKAIEVDRGSWCNHA